MLDDFTQIVALRKPADFAEAFGYTGGIHARYVGFYWERAGDELTWYDGKKMLCGAECQYFLTFLSEFQLHRYQIGDSENLPVNHLLVDRKNNTVYVGKKKLVEDFVKMQWHPIQ